MRVLLANLLNLSILAIILSGAGSCSKNDQTLKGPSADIDKFSLFPGKDNMNIDLSRHLISIRVPDSVRSGKSLAAIFTLSSGATLSIDGVTQQSGITRKNFENDLHYKITSADRRIEQDWIIQAF